MTKHATTDDLRAAIKAALPDMASDQFRAAQALLDALTPPMEEPTWPGYAMAVCPGDDRVHLHQRRLGQESQWECAEVECRWSRLSDPRPLTAAERAEHGIPGECGRPHAEPITDELVERCIEASTFMYPAWVRAVLREIGRAHV